MSTTGGGHHGAHHGAHADPHVQRAREALARHFGFRAFLEGQEEAVASILAGQDVLIVMPTGGGKSLCYQLPAMMLEGTTIVVSPLIALMKDQVDALEKKGLPAAYINSSLSESEMEQRTARMTRGEYRLVYVAPERFRSERFTEALARVKVGLFAVDEAHCISQWGHDFRPDYLRLRHALDRLGRPRVAALTATATPEVREDIVTQLGLGSNGRGEPRVLVSGFARKNLTFTVTNVRGGEEKLERVANAIRTLGTGIVYCATRKNVEQVAAAMMAAGHHVVGYHGGMTDEQRTLAQEEFMQKRVPVAVATNAFGMGVDRADVRFVIHYDIPGSVEAYYQEAGRAGRDGEPAWCELLYNYADVRTQQFFIEGANPSREVFEAVYDALCVLCAQGPIEMPITEIAVQASQPRNSMAVGTALNQLERAGFIERNYAPGSRVYTTQLKRPVLPFEELPIDYEYLEEKRARDERKLELMIKYAEHKGCRHHFVLAYFGDTHAARRCAACDNCLAHAQRNVRMPTADERVVLQKILSGVARVDGRFGRGRVVQMLTGSQAREVIEAGLDQYSTYGILAEYGSEYVWALLESLIEAGCVEVSAGEYPTVRLTPLGREVMLNKTVVELAWPELEQRVPQRRRGKRAQEVALVRAEDEPVQGSGNAALAAALRAWRRQRAGALGVPAYRIFPDATLELLAQQQPKNHIELLNMKGLGPAKVRQFGAEVLGIIRQFGN